MLNVFYHCLRAAALAIVLSLTCIFYLFTLRFGKALGELFSLLRALFIGGGIVPLSMVGVLLVVLYVA